MRRFFRDLQKNVLVGAASSLLASGGILLGSVVFAALFAGETIPVWSLVAVVAAATAVCFAIRLRAWSAAGIQEQYLQHLAQILVTLQEIITDPRSSVGLNEYVFQGMLAPAKDMLTRNPKDSIRLSVLTPTPENRFKMTFWAGHRLTSAKRFEIDINDSISRVAYAEGCTKAWDDVQDDDRYTQHPAASRATRAMVSVPLTINGETIGVFNAVSDRAAGFRPADRLYIECLGAIIEVVVGIQRGAAATMPTEHFDTVNAYVFETLDGRRST